MRKRVRWYVWKEHLFSLSGTPDYQLKFLGKSLSEYASDKFGAEIVDEFPKSFESASETRVILRSSHTCLPKASIETLVKRAEEEEKNCFFGAGWILVNAEPIERAKYFPVRTAAFLSPADYSFVAECIRREILKKLVRHGVIVENTSGVYVDSTSFIESGAVLSHDVTVSGRCLVRSGAYLRPYTVLEDCEIGSFAEIGPFTRLRGERIEDYGRAESGLVVRRKSQTEDENRAN